MGSGPRAHRRAVTVPGALIAGVLIAIGVLVILIVRGEGSRSAGEVTLSGTWAITRVDVGPSRQVTVPDGYYAGFSWRDAYETEVPGPDGEPTSVKFGSGFDLWDKDGDTSCTYTREGNTLTLTEALAGDAPLVNPSSLDTAISSAIDRAVTSNRTNKITVANTSDGGMSVTFGEVVFHLIKRN
jgi:hypothetical protein